MRKVVLLAVLTVFCLMSSVFAHHPWVEKEGERFFVAWGHPPKMIDPYEPNKVKDIKAFDLKGKEIPLTRIDEKDRVYLSSKAKVSMITHTFEVGYVVVTPEGHKGIKMMTKREAQRQGLQVVDSFYSIQFTKSLFSYSDAVMKPTGMKFEIVPLKNPYLLKQGELLPIKVLYEGKPLAGAAIKIGDYKDAGKTDMDGIAYIKIMEPGMQVVMARYRTVSSDPDADFLSFTTVLTWETNEGSK